MNTYQRKRLEKLAEFLKTVPSEKFDMELWMDTKAATARSPDPVDANACGTVGCAMGWATTIPSFRKAGLRLFHINDYLGRLSSACHIALVDKKTGHISSDFSAAADFFGISISESEKLFSPDHYKENQRKNPKFVSKKITNFLKKRDKFWGRNKILADSI